MAEDRASIDMATLLDNSGDAQVEFTAELGGEPYDFAVRYAVIEALRGAPVDPADQPAALVEAFRDAIEIAAARAAARAPAAGERIAIGESDIV